jgi:hypothetical protein
MVNKNKKGGLMIKFLTTLILAIIVFAPACILSSKIFRTSDQAKVNFENFVENFNDFYFNGEFGEEKSTILILDEKTAIVYYQKNKPGMNVFVHTLPIMRDYYASINRPGQCSIEKNCLCLLRKSTFEKENFVDSFGKDDVSASEKFSAYLNGDDEHLEGILSGPKLTITPKRVLCSDLDFDLSLDTCNIGEAINLGDQGYLCTDGFLIERKLIEKGLFVIDHVGYDNPRRTLLQMTKLDGVVHLEAK